MSKKSIVSIIVMIAMIIGLLSYNTFFKKVIPVSEVSGAYRDGMELMPVDYDTTGIKKDTAFRLTFEREEPLALEEIREKFRSEPSLDYEIAKEDDGYIIKSTTDFKEGVVYSFYINDTKWVYRTESGFELLGTLPRHQGTNVPIDTGIEFYFSHKGAEVEEHFNIEPEVKGRFETYGNSVVFIPKDLEPSTIYTVTVTKGLPLKGSEETLEEDYTFSFETSEDPDGTRETIDGYFSYRKQLNDFSSEDVINIPFNYGIYKEKYDTTVASTVYRFSSIEEAMKALESNESNYYWSYYNNEKEPMDTSELEKVLSFDQEIEGNYGQDAMIQLNADLEVGIYFIESTWEDITFTSVFQVTDLAYYAYEDSENQYFWTHDLETDLPVEQLTISIEGETLPIVAKGNGLYTLQQGLVSEITEAYVGYYLLQSNHKSILKRQYIVEHTKDIGSHYWRYFQSDRNLYQPDDLVEFYGFLQHRETGEAPAEITVELTEQRWFYFGFWPGMEPSMALETVTLPLEGGFYNGKIQLPNLSQGSYELVVKDGNHVLNRHYISVEKYVKPDYKMEVSKDKEAVMVGEEVNFTVMTKFFEGTPVANLPISYNTYGSSYEDGSGETDLSGEYVYSHVPTYRDGDQDEIRSGFNVRAVLPESGELYGNESVRVFANDIHIGAETTVEDEVGTLKFTVNGITLDRLNDGTAENSMDFLADPIKGQKITARIIRNEWIKKEVGEYYDYIDKVVRKSYEYHREQEELDVVEVVTNEEGIAIGTIDLPKEDNVYYTTEIKTFDGNDRKMLYERYFSNGTDYRSNERFFGRNITELKLNQESYKNGDKVTMTMVEIQGETETNAKGKSFMFVVGANGIQQSIYRTYNSGSFVFNQQMMPNAQSFGIAFTGNGYRISQMVNIQGDYQDKLIDLDVKTDKESYKPGEIITVDLSATYVDEGGNVLPVADGMVNLSMVDEALFALRDQNVDTLNQLYQWIGSGILSYSGSHNNGEGYESFRRYGGYDLAAGGLMKSEAKMDTLNMARTESTTLAMDEGSAAIRSEFKDTAKFVTILLDEDGKGQITYTLPDNVTSWRITTSAISEALQAGSLTETVNVTLPFFVSPNLNKTYLVGDQPYVGTVAYGDALAEDESITYTVSCEAVDYDTVLEGKAFEKVNLPLWNLEEGSYEVLIEAESAKGHSDAYIETIQVVKTYHEMAVIDTYDAFTGLKISTRDDEMTTLIFADRSKGQYVNDLYNLLYSGGRRIEQQYGRLVAARLLEEYFKETVEVNDIDLSDYLTEEGGISILPYSESDIDATVKLIPYVTNESHRLRISSYLYRSYNSKDQGLRSKALYGLALLGEPVLLEVNGQMSIDNLVYEDYVYLAMAYGELGDTYMANQIYEEHIMPLVESFEGVSRVKEGLGTEGYIYNTSIILPLTAMIDVEVSEELFWYVHRNYSKTYLSTLDRLRYVALMLDKEIPEESSMSYIYNGKAYDMDFKEFYGNSIEIPSAKTKDFSITKVTGDVLVIAKYNGIGLAGEQRDELVTTTREFQKYENNEKTWNFKQGDIVKVVIDWKIGKGAIDNTYKVVDFAPSGLVPIKSTWGFGIQDRNYWYRDIDGQKVTFGVYKAYKDYRPLYYYARVVSPGTYRADGTLIQGAEVVDSYNVTEAQTITIEP